MSKRTILTAVVALALLAAAVIALSLGNGLAPQAEAVPPTPTPTPDPKFPVARVVTDSADLIDGPQSRGRIGDYFLANSKIQVVIQDIQRNLMVVGTYGGQIIDADLVRELADPERDAFEEWAVGIHLENTAHYTAISVINDGSDGQPAVIRATGVDDLLDVINPSSQVAGFDLVFPAAYDDVDLPVEFTTDYILAPNDTFVRVETTIRNIDPTDDIETFVTEFMSASGLMELFLPGYGFGEPLITAECDLCDFIAWNGIGEAEGVAYGYIHEIADSTLFTTSGVVIPLVGTNAALALIGAAMPNYTIPANGGEITLTRYFAVADSVGSIVDIRNQIVGLTTGTISGTVTRDGSPVEGVDVVVLGDPADGPGTDKNIVSHYRTDANGDYQGTLPPDAYTVRAQLDGHMPASPDPANVTIMASMTTVQDFTIPVAGRVRVTIVDESNAAIAGKVSLVGFDQNPDPGNSQFYLGFVNNETGVFGDIYADTRPYGLVDAVFVDQAGDSGEFFLEPASYRVVVSHGTEYSVYEEDIVVTAGALTEVDAQIARVLDTTGFASGDFHVHALASPDGRVTNEQRIVSMLAEGVDFFISTDHQFQVDYAPVIASLGAGSLISSAVSAENTTPDYGHFIGWPRTIDPAQVNGGALDWAVLAPDGEDFPSFGNFMMSPGDIFANLVADPGVDTVHINHMDSFFGPGGLSIDTTFVPPQDFADNASKRLDPAIPNLFDDSFTALEVWQGTDGNNIPRFLTRNLGDWFNMFNQGLIRTGYAVSDTHKQVVNQSGFPRTFFASPTDDPGALAAIADTLSGNINDGRAIGTNGPYIEVTSSAASTGQNGGLALGLPTLISTTDGNATITVDIQSPLWAEFDRVEYYINNVPFPNYADDDPSTPPLWPVTPDVVQTAGVDFTVNTIDDFPLITGAQHLEATTSLKLNGLTEDAWVVVLVRGTDGVSKPIFPVVPNDLDQTANPTVADLTDGNLGEDGVPALAFANPLFIDINGNAAYDPSPVDSDRDGCTNDRELQSKANAGQGGGRSPSRFWDFFDVWTHPLGQPTLWERDRVVNVVGDIIGTASRFGPGTPQSEEDAFAAALTPPVSDSGYHAGFDRGPVIGPNNWNRAPADGAINIPDDIIGVAVQFGVNCL